MSAKEFFKGKSFKCIIALLCVLLISGVFLTIMNSLLYVSDAERLERAINKIYGKSVKTEAVAVTDYDQNATINEAYKIKDDGNYLVKSTGKGGFDNGTVTCWVVVEVSSGSVSGVGKVVIDSNVGQSYINRVSEAALKQFGELYETGIYYSPDLITAATVNATKNAICNSVNGALAYVNALCGNVAEDIYTEYKYISNIQTTRSSHVMKLTDPDNLRSVEAVEFTVVSNGYGMAAAFTSKITVDKDGIIQSFEIVTAGSTDQSYTDKAMENVNSKFLNQNLEGLLAVLNLGIEDEITYPGGIFPTTGATNSTYSLYNAAVFAAANYQKAIDDYLATLPPAEEEEAPETDEGGAN